MSANTAVEPVPNVMLDRADWNIRRAQKQEAVLIRGHDLIFIGDSITRRFEHEEGGIAVWKKHYGHRRALNLGYGWDCTQNVLWRLRNGEFVRQRPRLVVLNIGTNNLTGNDACRANTAEEIVEGIAALCEFVRGASPATKILVMAVFPRGRRDEAIHGRVKELNVALKVWLAARPHLLHLDIGARFLDAGGEVDAGMFPDRCHPVEPGYEIWAEELEVLVKEHVDQLYTRL